MRRSLVWCLAVSLLAGCGSGRPSRAAERAVADRFAHAVVQGEQAEAERLVARRADRAVRAQATLLASSFAEHRGVLETGARPTGTGEWSFAYRRRVDEPDGSFSRERGLLVVRVTRRGGAAVAFAAIVGRQIVYSSHHDSVLLPSKR